MSVQMKTRNSVIGLFALFVVAVIILLSTNIGKITEAVKTPPLTTEQIDSLAKKVSQSHELMLYRQQQNLQAKVDSIEKRLTQLDALEEQAKRSDQFNQEIERLDSLIRYMRVYEIPRVAVSVHVPKPKSPVAGMGSIQVNRFSGKTLNDTLAILRNQLIKK